MNISYKWLRELVDTTLTPQEVADVLTSIGLETGSIDEVETIPGGLRGLVIGKVLTCEMHPDSDHLHITTVSVGDDREPLQIVCGAPNVAAGQAVVVATVGTVLGSGNEQFTIKKSRLRGVDSYGMICSETEIGVGSDSSGIIVLDPEKVTVGMPAAEYYGVESDYILEVDITPNRVDATSHYGVARDLAAYLTLHNGKEIRAELPDAGPELPVGKPCPVEVELRGEAELCPRFEGVVIRSIKVTDSPEWLQKRLNAIGLKPVNNVVDITNYVLHEVGQPLHAYSLNAIDGNRLVVGPAAKGAKILTLDHVEHELDERDIVIADAEGTPLCVGGVMGSEAAGTTARTTDIFLEAANFNPTRVRKTARRLGINSDSSFRFERGLDADNTHWALRRAANLILEIAGGTIDGGVTDQYRIPSQPYSVTLNLTKMRKLVGQEIPLTDVKRILKSLEIECISEKGEELQLKVPKYRYDVTRDVDVIEDLMRIYGYNRIRLSGYIRANLSTKSQEDINYRRQLFISEQLVGAGFNELLNNSLSSRSNYEGLTSFPADNAVELLNPLSHDLDVMRQTLLFGGLQNIGYNLRRQKSRFYFFEWGKCYAVDKEKAGKNPEKPLQGYTEESKLGIWIAGQRVSNSWAHANEETSPFELKAALINILNRLGISPIAMQMKPVTMDIFDGTAYELTLYQGRRIGFLGAVSQTLRKRADISIPIYFMELDWDQICLLADRNRVEAQDLPRFPLVKRDLALLVDKAVSFVDIESVAYKTERKLLRSCELFDVYEGKNLPDGKKSYAVSFYLRDDEKTMSDKQIDGIMQKLAQQLNKQLGAELR